MIFELGTQLKNSFKMICFVPAGEDGSDHPAEGGRARAQHQGGRRAQVADTHLQDIQGPGSGPDGAALRRRRRHQR